MKISSLKKLVVIALVAAISGATSLVAGSASSPAAMHDGVMMKDGKMMVMKDGKTMAMEKEMKMSDGSVCMVTGECVMKDGKKMMMKDGDMMTMDGKMMHHNTKGEMKTGTTEKK